MARIVVETEIPIDGVQRRVVLEERVSSVHLDSELGTAHMAERIGWAVEDAEELDREAAGSPSQN